MLLRSAIPKEEKENFKKRKYEEEKYIPLPIFKYPGKTKYFTDLIGCAGICDELLEGVNKSEDLFYLGFDMEWPFSFKTGPGRTAVIQISPNLDTCYILHVSELKKLPKALSLLLANPKVRLTGVNIKNDVRKLSRDFSGFDVEAMINNCIDCGVYANTILPVQQRWSMQKLINYLFKMEINKDRKVRMSKWHEIPLSKEQRIYAAIDAYASLKIYVHLRELETNKCENII